MKNKQITFIGLNFFPEDTAIGLYSSQWVEFLIEHGFDVTVVTAFPYYPQWKISKGYENKPTFFKEEYKGAKVLRYKQYVPKSPSFFKRILHLSDFTLGSLINLFKIKECDLVISVVPFTSSVLLGYIQKKRFKAPLWIHIQDFEFDAALQTGVGSKKNWIFSLLFKLEKWLFSKADVASTISQSMLNILGQKTPSKQFYLPNWIDENQIDPENSTQHKYLISDKINLLYSGNIGDKQDWETFVEFCKDIDPNRYEVVIVGDGSKREWVISQLEALKSVSFHDPVPYDELSNLLCSADAHLLFQKPDVLDTVMPSKVLGMMASAKPSIVIGNERSEVKTIFEESRGGLYFNHYSKDLIDAMDCILGDLEMNQSMGKLARAYVIKNYSKDQILLRMAQLLNEL